MYSVYISGAIEHNDNFVLDFTRAKIQLEKKGFRVLSPLDTKAHKNNLPAKFCMMEAVDLLKDADMITVVTKDIPSVGMKIELELAKYYEIPYVQYDILLQEEK